MSDSVNLFQLGLILDQEDEFVVHEPVYGDRDYDYGYAEDGWVIPPPCIIDGTPMNACVYDYYASLHIPQINQHYYH